MSLRQKTVVPFEEDFRDNLRPFKRDDNAAIVYPRPVGDMMTRHCIVHVCGNSYRFNAVDLARALLRATGQEELLK